MTTRKLLCLVLFVGMATPLTGWAAEARRPNVLLILADDLGFSDLGCHGSEIATPNIDRLAKNGLRFSSFYNTARCWPTRGSLLTGYYAQQIRRDTVPGLPSGGRGERPAWAVLLPRMLKQAGYRSYHTGKWHVDGMPIAEGFDHSYYLKDQGRFFNPRAHWRDDVLLPAVEKGTDFYATTALADHVIATLKEHAAEHGGEPFFQYLAFAAPHFPLHALPEDIAKYEGVYDAGWEAVRARRWARMRELGLLDESRVPNLSSVERDLGPPYHFPEAFEILGPGEVNRPVPWASLTPEQRAFQAKKMQIHAAMIHRMDIEIGRVLAQIESMGERDDTLVMFLSDNGASAEIMVRDDGHDPAAPPGSAGTYLCLGPGWSTVANTPFRRHKTWTHEGGISTPLVVNWPNGIVARGEFRRTPGHVIDVVPTLLELAGVAPPAEAPPKPGRSLVPVFERDTNLDRDGFWWFHDGHRAIRVGDWKAVAPISEPWELYDLSRDRDESTDLAVAQPEKLDELVTEWQRRLDEYTALASRDLPARVQERAREASRRPLEAKPTQEAARSKRRWVLHGGEELMLGGRHAFVMTPENPIAAEDETKPWILYAPTLNPYPDRAESWMHERFLAAGIAVAGIDVGEAYGSPRAFPHFERLYAEMQRRGYSKRPALLGRSRGGLWVSSWAIAHPDRVAGIGGIYPVFDLTTYPKLDRAAPAYGMTAEELTTKLDDLNPIRRADVLAQARIPVTIIHGAEDKVVPLAENSAALEKAYAAADAADQFQLIRVPDQGHNFWRGFFECEELVTFLVERAKAGAGIGTSGPTNE